MDLEKVLTWLEICGENNDCSGCCPYSENGFGESGQCRESLMADAYALLKEQEVVSGHWLDDTGHWIEGDRNGTDPHARTTGEMIDTFRCSWCGFYQYWKTPFCPNCGAKMEE